MDERIATGAPLGDNVTVSGGDRFKGEGSSVPPTASINGPGVSSAPMEETVQAGTPSQGSDHNCSGCTDGSCQPKSELPIGVIDTFDIPEEMARRLDELIGIRGVRLNLLQTLIGDERFDTIEKGLIPIEREYDSIRDTITTELVPNKYRSDKFKWRYAGYEIAKNVCWIQNT